MVLHIFNPETDYALASNGEAYTPPASLQAMRASLCLLPSLFAEEDDAILLPDFFKEIEKNGKFFVEFPKNQPLMELTDLKRLKLILPNYLGDFFASFPNAEIRPWGWNKALVNQLRSCGVPEENLPSENGIRHLRNISNRHFTIPFLLNMEGVRHPEIAIPNEFSDIDNAIDFWNKNNEVYFKAPWSSSGRGLLYTKDLELRHIKPWLRGVIRSQGSVIGEIAYKRKLDFATEWECRNGEVKFLGLSTFITSPRGKYKSNAVAEQETLAGYILNAIDITRKENNLSEIIGRQKLLLETYVSAIYDGPLGIDMLVTENGNVNPCVEINFRNTMGRVAIDIHKRIMSDHSQIIERNYLKQITKDGIFSPMNFLSTFNQIDNN